MLKLRVTQVLALGVFALIIAAIVVFQLTNPWIMCLGATCLAISATALLRRAPRP